MWSYVPELHVLFLSNSVTQLFCSDFFICRTSAASSACAFSGLLTDGGMWAKNPLPLNPSHIYYNDETWHSYTLQNEDPKNV